MMNPVEELTIGYFRSVEGDYERIEPQVYDVALPELIVEQLQLSNPGGISRVTFDTEALTDHPQAHFLAFGHPTLDQIFAMAHQQGAVGKIFLSGFNLQPHQLLSKLKQQLHLHKDLHIEFGTPRILHFTLWFYWFQATFLCDEKTQYVFEVGIDQYNGRLTRRFQDLLDAAQSTAVPIAPYSDAGGMASVDAYLLARAETVVKLRPMMRNYKEKLAHHLMQESNQIAKYFDGMLSEVEERQKKSAASGKEGEAFSHQKKSLELERQARLVELQKKMTLKTDLKLLNLLSVVMPKIITPLKLTAKRHAAVDLKVIWNPLSQSVEPIACPQCGSPTLEFVQASQGAIQCAQCKA